MNISLLNRFQAVLFDLDGVLIESMSHHVSAWKQVFSELGINIPEDVLRRAEGEKAKITIRRLALKHNLALSETQLEELIERKRALYRKNAPRGLRPIAAATVHACRSAGLKTAIVTGSVRSNLDWTLSVEELSLFDVVLSSEHYANGKPHPEPYLKAARLLNLEPDKCLVIENAPLGIQSAKAAGMACIAITTTLPAEELSGADLIVPDLDGFQDLKFPLV